MDDDREPSCAICLQNSPNLLEVSLAVAETVRELYQSGTKYNKLLVNSEICLSCTGRIYQLAAFIEKRAQLSEEDLPSHCCNFCGSDKVMRSHTAAALTTIQETRWAQNFCDGQRLECCYACFELLDYSVRLKSNLDAEVAHFDRLDFPSPVALLGPAADDVTQEINNNDEEDELKTELTPPTESFYEEKLKRLPPISEMVINAVKTLQEPEGSSQKVIENFLAVQYKFDVEELVPLNQCWCIERYLNLAVEKGELLQNKNMEPWVLYQLPDAVEKENATKKIVRPATQPKTTVAKFKKLDVPKSQPPVNFVGFNSVKMKSGGLALEDQGHINRRRPHDGTLRVNVCPICGSTYIKKSSLTRHLKIHTNSD